MTEQPDLVAVPSHAWTAVGDVEVYQASGVAIAMTTRPRRASWQQRVLLERAWDDDTAVDVDGLYATDEEQPLQPDEWVVRTADGMEVARGQTELAPTAPMLAQDMERSAPVVGARLTLQRRGRRGPALPDIALSGLAGAGKDTAAAALVEEYGYTVGKFARPLYEAMLRLNPYDEHGNRLADRVGKVGWEVVKRNQPEARRLLQVFGTEVGRQMFGESFWVEQAARWRLEQEGPVVWTDTRFPNEVEYVTGHRVMRHPLSQRGGLWVHIVRPGQTIEGSGHASETSLPPITEADYVLQNEGTVAALHSKVLHLMLQARQ